MNNDCDCLSMDNPYIRYWSTLVQLVANIIGQ